MKRLALMLQLECETVECTRTLLLQLHLLFLHVPLSIRALSSTHSQLEKHEF